jgi:nicotinate-nucleotide adenylyltransferase
VSLVPASGPIGLLGGSFDPVHAGHCQLARDAQAALGLAQLRFLPAGKPWQKGAITPAYHRVAMLELALQEQHRRDPDGPQGASWVVDAREIDRPGPSYTVDTLRELRAELGDAVALVWITGFDQLARLPSWHEWESLIGLAHIAYTQRADFPGGLAADLEAYVTARSASAAVLAAEPAGCFVAFPMQPVACSASRIRAALSRGDVPAARPFLAPGVLEYIQTHQLYLAVHG